MTFVTVFRRVPRPITLDTALHRLRDLVDTDEPDRRMELLHDNVKQYGTVFNTVAPGTDLTGVLVQREITNR